MRKALRRLALAGALIFSATISAQAQDYPTKPIRIVVPFAPGGAADRVARLLGEKLQARWGQVVTVENRAGAGGNIGAEMVFRAPPDGYTLLLTPAGVLVINKSLYGKLNFEPEAFVPISAIVNSFTVLSVHPKVAANDMPELLRLARANPGKLNYATPGSGSTSHLGTELMKTLANVQIVHVPYKGNGPALNDLLGGQVDLMLVELSSALPHIKSGRLRALAIGGDKRSDLLPGVPALAESVPGFAMAGFSSLVAPPGTPPAIVASLVTAVREIVSQPDVIKRFNDMSLAPVGNTPAEMAVLMKQETERWAKVIRDTGAKAE